MTMMLFPEDDCVLYKPDEDKVYRPDRDYSGFRFLANSGKWFLVVDPGLNLYIIDLFSEKRINLPPLESIQGASYSLARVEDKVLMEKVSDGGNPCGPRTAEDLRGVLWVAEEDNKEGLKYLVVWRFDKNCHYLGFCKNGYDHHLGTPTDPGIDRTSIRRELQGLDDMVLQREILYILTPRRYIRILDFSGKIGFKDVSGHNLLPMLQPPLSERKHATKIISKSEKIAVTRPGDVLLVDILVYEDATSNRRRIFRLSKRDPTLDPRLHFNLVEVDSLGDEALLLDSGIVVPADKTLGIEPNSIYFTRDDRVRSKIRKYPSLDICVYNLATKALKSFPGLSNLNIKEALWFLPS